MSTLCLFNPEHDICLSNGSKHFVPPASAVHFAHSAASLMEHIYLGSRCMAVDELEHKHLNDVDKVVAWGWDARLLHQLRKRGVPSHLLPTENFVEAVRQLQHRSSILPLQQSVDQLQGVENSSRTIDSLAQLEPLFSQQVVLKAPWSGAGRGLCWVKDQLTERDRLWALKVMREQRCLIAEPRRNVVMDFAMEYSFEAPNRLTLIGYSLFETQHGIYRANRLLNDAAIKSQVIDLLPQGAGQSLFEEVSHLVEQHLFKMMADQPALNGIPHVIGVDLYVDDQKRLYVSEMNLRHTMGMVAHQYLANHPERNGQLWTPYMATDLLAVTGADTKFDD